MNQIKRPQWEHLFGACALEPKYHDEHMALNEWFDTYVTPVNKMLSEGVEVYGVWDTTNIPDIVCRFGTTEDLPTHKALIINIEPIVKWECPCGEKVMFADTEDCKTPLCYSCATEIHKALERG